MRLDGITLGDVTAQGQDPCSLQVPGDPRYRLTSTTRTVARQQQSQITHHWQEVSGLCQVLIGSLKPQEFTVYGGVIWYLTFNSVLSHMWCVRWLGHTILTDSVSTCVQTVHVWILWCWQDSALGESQNYSGKA